MKESFCNNNEKVEEEEEEDVTVKSNVIEKKVTTRRNFRFRRSSQGKKQPKGKCPNQTNGITYMRPSSRSL